MVKKKSWSAWTPVLWLTSAGGAGGAACAGNPELCPLFGWDRWQAADAFGLQTGRIGRLPQQAFVSVGAPTPFRC